MQLIPDEELERLAEQHGPESHEAYLLENLRRDRARDKQVFAFRVGDYLVVGPMPDAHTEMSMAIAAQVAKRLRRP